MVATAVVTGVEVAVLVAAGIPLLSETTFRNAFPVVNLGTVVGALVGALILSRHPRHRIGWLFCWGQLGVATGLLLRTVADTGVAGGLELPAGLAGAADVLAVLLGSTFALMLLAVWAFLAPDGRPASPRWRPFLIGTLVAYGVHSVGVLLFAATGAAWARDVVFGSGQLGVYLGLTAAVVSLVRRLARSTGEARLQLRWLAAAAVVLASAPIAAVVCTLLRGATPLWVIALLHVGYLGIPVATGFAVLRYRLYDIDRLLAGSVVLAVLAVLAYAASVVTAGLAATLLPGVTADTGLSLVVFVLVVGASQLVRAPVGRLADQLVYGPQALSYEALVRFSRQLTAAGRDTPLLDGVAEAAGRLVSADRATAVLTRPDGTEQRATWAAGSVPRPDRTAPWVVPVRHAGQDVGRLEVAVPDFAGSPGRRRRLIAALAERVAEPFAHLRLEAELRSRAAELERINASVVASRARLFAARDVGRRQVADRISGEVVAPLRPLDAHLSTVERVAASDPAAAAAETDLALTATGAAIDQLRQITSTVYSRLLADRGLAAALAAEGQGRIRIQPADPPRWPTAVESVLFASCLDVLRVVAGPVTVRLSSIDSQAEARLVLPPPGPTETGLAGVVERIEVLGGEVVDQGPVIALRLPLVSVGPGPTSS